jgi:N6-adenosine-specific RNA methylase IME4
MDAIELRENAKYQLEQIKTIETGVDYLNKVKAIETWAKAEKKDAELQNMIAEQKIRTQRILGGLLKDNEVSKYRERNLKQNTEVTRSDFGKSLSDFGITKNDSSTFQKIAAMPEEIFEQEIAVAKSESMKRVELTTSRVLNAAKEYERKNDIAQQKQYIEAGAIEKPDGLFDVIAIDPPWNYGREYDPEGSRVANPYPEMSQTELLEMKPPFKPDAVCFLWTTHAFIWDAKQLLDHWGFTYKACIVWDKEKIGMGAWLRMQCEFCLVGVKGKPFWNNTTWRDIIREPRRQHSRKPDAFYEMVEAITAGRRLDYFSREQRTNWVSYGNTPEKF